MIYSIIAWFAIIPLLILIEKSKSPKRSALFGFIFGILLFGCSFFWINTLTSFVGFFAVLGWITLALFQSVFLAVFAYLSKKLNINLTFLQALLWVAIEYARGMGAFGVSEGVLGYSQFEILPLIQIASIFTVFGVSFLIILFNIACAKLIAKKNPILLISSVILIIAALIYGSLELKNNSLASNGKPATKSRCGNRDKRRGFQNKIIKIAIIQGNISQEKKMSSSFNGENFSIHAGLTLQAAKESPDIIIWPETTVFSYLLHDQIYMNKIKRLAKDTKAYLMIGTPNFDEKKEAYNSIAAISPSGEVVGRYDKQHLVTFGEYLPFRPILYPFLKMTNYFDNDFYPGPEKRPIKVLGINFGALICFESTFPEMARQKVKEGADILLVVTNDAWFYDSSAPYEHFNQAIFRAIENRRSVIQCANTGISGFIDPYGRVLKKLKLNERGYLTFQIPLP
ncbi:apolipoprotein N-acyltransferase [Candidatus Saganbacteria bacterium]|nr:apolipoprotein N-acyltransferase [Candidatus Saganbacteria bacterium]